ncbi:MAG: hypothetical protein A3H01_00940 [Candidatus Wildermuthbacteria bacterium RIFCSPLOWO2_12_FULL_40_9]|uniref:Uncharacterized protein n=2 Tax=Candidatus Wildermuthiibacteriota TaxID=1817923 RepID=A0A1G2RDK5_9BACT|nr:MAG: hypothetical protein A3F15_02160 [Candidatus Wildermuthbacteria bacterium RIFCSPHIGHO2_12_FULL_40_12]OHA76826.1 MAG: hypothetical protein A3H01_00940 [Candidatus Wildermuthbacteria bacterium RIFCSPLOWO2_12_FULL_40_9]
MPIWLTVALIIWSICSVLVAAVISVEPEKTKYSKWWLGLCIIGGPITMVMHVIGIIQIIAEVESK